MTVSDSVHLPVGRWLAIGVFAVLASLATRGLPALWRHESDRWERQPEWWLRGLPTAVVAGWLMLIAVPLTVIGMSQHGTVADVFALLLGVVLILVVIAGLVWVAVVLVNRPRVAVPPHLRDRPGLLTHGDQPARPPGRHGG
jgi:hypothetical protein